MHHAPTSPGLAGEPDAGPAADQTLVRVLVEKGEGGGTGRVMRSYLGQLHEEEHLILSNLPPWSRENSRFALCYELEAPSR